MADGTGALAEGMSAESILEGMERPRARTGNSGGMDESCKEGSRSCEGSMNRTPLVEEGFRRLTLLKTGRSNEVSFIVLNARIAGSALKGAWIKGGDHEQGSVGLRCNCFLLFASRNFAGITGTSGSEARLIVERGDFRVLVREDEQLTEETVDPVRVGGKEP